MLQHCYKNKRVLVTGHTGFKGSWLCEWLLALGAEVYGYALSPPTTPSLFEQLGLEGRLRHQIGDVRNVHSLQAWVQQIQPDHIFHLAAQSLVRLSYEQPLETYQVNVLGTANLLDALRTADWHCGVVVVTSDKCYDNREWTYAYRETDPLGGRDPYSSSKADAELVISAYRSSFFQNHPIRVASARAGNVIGGGDWASDRIVPDCVRALQSGKVIQVRNPQATRPWQHVLEPICGYLRLGSLLAEEREAQRDAPCDTAFNFGPGLDSNRSVQELVSELLRGWPGQWQDCSGPNALHEASFLNLASDKAFHLLGWKPIWDFKRAVAETIRGYHESLSAGCDADLQNIVRGQITRFAADGRQAGLGWLASCA
jgi:CDP-glucose 4,6-dehydratase